jgi:hypothetical protein
MVRRWIARLGVLFSIALAGALAGCGMCQNCADQTGPVIHSPNGADYDDSPRAGSAVGGGPMMQGETVMEGETIVDEGMVYEGRKAPVQRGPVGR